MALKPHEEVLQAFGCCPECGNSPLDKSYNQSPTKRVVYECDWCRKCGYMGLWSVSSATFHKEVTAREVGMTQMAMERIAHRVRDDLNEALVDAMQKALDETVMDAMQQKAFGG